MGRRFSSSQGPEFTRLRGAWFLGAGLHAILVGSGCAVIEDEQPRRLEEVSIARDFIFSTQRALLITFEGPVDRGNTLVEIRSPDAQLLYRGPLGMEDPLRLAVGSWVDKLIVTVDRGRGPEQEELQVQNGWVKIAPDLGSGRRVRR
jgi:hypothetical protein